jgi:two-component system, OmpR family, response regulator
MAGRRRMAITCLPPNVEPAMMIEPRPHSRTMAAPFATHHARAMTRCLLVDDDAEIRDLVSDYLRGHGIDVTAVADGAAMQRELKGMVPNFDVLLLDLMLPGESGLELCRWVRQREWSLPLIMLTAQGDPISRVVGLELGADDYIPKPFEPRELVARIKALLRRAGAPIHARLPQAGVVRFEGWVLHRMERRLMSPQQVLIPLSNSEYRLLCAFVDQPMRVLDRSQLLELTREGDTVITDRSIDLAVSRLRQKLALERPDRDLIRTVRGVGYQFTAKLD